MTKWAIWVTGWTALCGSADITVKLQSLSYYSVGASSTSDSSNNSSSRSSSSGHFSSETDSSTSVIEIEKNNETTLPERVITSHYACNWLDWCNSKQALFFEGCRVKSKMPSLPVAAFLLEPVQRITRYPLLLRRLYSVQKETPEYDEKIFDLAQISMLIVLAEQAAESADRLSYCARESKRHQRFSGLKRLLYIFSWPPRLLALVWLLFVLCNKQFLYFAV